MIKKLLCGIIFGLCAAQAFAWTDGELLIWISDNRAYHALGDLGKTFEKDVGVPVKVETQEQITEKFQAAAQGGKGPDIFFWAHDRIGEWADAGLIKPLEVKDDFKAGFIPMSWDAVTHDKQIWGYPISLEAVSLIYNKKFVTGTPPAQLSELSTFSKDLKAKNPNVIAIMWDYNTPYFSWPFLASAGAYPFKKTADGYDLKDIGVDSPGALQGLQAIVDLMKEGIMPKGGARHL
jgi:maltose/maltodextrin transport system substrate-binding protein